MSGLKLNFMFSFSVGLSPETVGLKVTPDVLIRSHVSTAEQCDVQAA
jgi:hypothetical protein